MHYFKISRKSAQQKPNCFTRTDGRTDMTNLILAFRNFANALKTEVAIANMDENRWKTPLPIQTERQTAIKNI
jgi:hypothetical protein